MWARSGPGCHAPSGTQGAGTEVRGARVRPECRRGRDGVVAQGAIQGVVDGLTGVRWKVLPVPLDGTVGVFSGVTGPLG